jgi:hypothetical protein
MSRLATGLFWQSNWYSSGVHNVLSRSKTNSLGNKPSLRNSCNVNVRDSAVDDPLAERGAGGGARRSRLRLDVDDEEGAIADDSTVECKTKNRPRQRQKRDVFWLVDVGGTIAGFLETESRSTIGSGNELCIWTAR